MSLLSRLFPRKPNPRPGEFYRMVEWQMDGPALLDPFSPRYEVKDVRDGWVKLDSPFRSSLPLSEFHRSYRLAPNP